MALRSARCENLDFVERKFEKIPFICRVFLDEDTSSAFTARIEMKRECDTFMAPSCCFVIRTTLKIPVNSALHRVINRAMGIVDCSNYVLIAGT